MADVCEKCKALITPALTGACSSVGIEHGQHTAITLAHYLRAVHEREHQ